MSCPALYGRALRLDAMTVETLWVRRSAIGAQTAPTTLTFAGSSNAARRPSREGGVA